MYTVIQKSFITLEGLKHQSAMESFLDGIKHFYCRQFYFSFYCISCQILSMLKRIHSYTVYHCMLSALTRQFRFQPISTETPISKRWPLQLTCCKKETQITELMTENNLFYCICLAMTSGPGFRCVLCEIQFLSIKIWSFKTTTITTQLWHFLPAWEVS